MSQDLPPRTKLKLNLDTLKKALENDDTYVAKQSARACHEAGKELGFSRSDERLQELGNFFYRENPSMEQGRKALECAEKLYQEVKNG